MEEGKLDALLDVTVETAGSAAVRIVVAGRGQAAERLASDVAELVRGRVAGALGVTDVQSSPMAPGVESAGQTNAADAVAGIHSHVTPAAARQEVKTAPPAEPVKHTVASNSAPYGAESSPVTSVGAAPWFKRKRTLISGSVGGVLIALALLVPLLVPAEMRREVLPMPIALGLVGALSLFSAFMPDPQPRAPKAAEAKPIPSAPPKSAARPGAGALSFKPVSAQRRIGGAAFGAVLAIAGFAAPLVLPNVSPDDRFLMMLGFAPVALIGAFLIWVFLRRAGSPAYAAPVNARAPRAAAGAATKASGALAALGVLLGVVVLLVVLATVVPLLTSQP